MQLVNAIPDQNMMTYKRPWYKTATNRRSSLDS